MSNEELLKEISNQLYRWAQESKTSGWSTHQFERMQKLASKINEHLATKPEPIKAPSWVEEWNASGSNKYPI